MTTEWSIPAEIMNLTVSEDPVNLIARVYDMSTHPRSIQLN